MTTALLDRLTHLSHIVETGNPRWRPEHLALSADGTRINQRTATVDCESGAGWRVPLAKLRHVMDI